MPLELYRSDEHCEYIMQARREIQEAIKARGEFSHNMITASLRNLASKVDYVASNDLVDEFDLDRKFGISKHPITVDMVFQAVMVP
jgi:hypothetical protein